MPSFEIRGAGDQKKPGPKMPNMYSPTTPMKPNPNRRFEPGVVDTTAVRLAYKMKEGFGKNS